MYYQLSKREKKIAKACIDKGLENEFEEGLTGCGTVIDKWRTGKFISSREAYHALFQALHDRDKAIARRYDNLTGSRWLRTVAELLSEGRITEDDTKDFSEETKTELQRLKFFFQDE